MSDTPKRKYPREQAIAVAKVLCDALKPVTTRLIVAGSLRRMKREVGDVEILYIPKLEPLKEVRQDELFADHAGPIRLTNMSDLVINALLTRGVIEKRLNVGGSEMWGEKNKLARHVASGIPVDLFAATEANWWNYLVCRTGGAENNVRIATAAKRKRTSLKGLPLRDGWTWNPYGDGFSNELGEKFAIESEADVFAFVGLPFLEPKDRS